MNFSETNIAEYSNQGFTRIDAVFDASEVAEMQAAFNRLYAKSEAVANTLTESDGRVSAASENSLFTFQRNSEQDPWNLRHIAWVGGAEATLRTFGQDRRLLKIAQQLLGSDSMNHLINQAHYKKPGSAIAFDWHQDIQFRGIANGGFDDLRGDGSYVQLLLALDDTTEESGPLKFIPKSNRLGYLEPPLEQHKQIDFDSAVAPLLKSGDVVAFGPYTIHGSQANLSKQSRRVFINGFAYPGSDLKSHSLEGEGELLSV